MLFQDVELALIQKLLPEELVLKIFELLDPYVLGRLACVCSQWRSWTMYSPLWKAACFEAFQADDPAERTALQRRLYRQVFSTCFAMITTHQHLSSLTLLG
jgi:hypothetical protein